MFCFSLSDDEDEDILGKMSTMKNRRSNELEEDLERLARTIFVGNLPVAFTRKVRKHFHLVSVCVKESVHCNKLIK